MKTIYSAVFVLFVIATGTMLQSCATKQLDPMLYQRQWMLVSFKKYDRDFLIKNKAQIDLSPKKSTPNQYDAFMGCNQMFFTAKFSSPNKVKFSELGSTMMFCEDNKNLEIDFAESLPTMILFEIEGHHLTLSDGKGNQMKFVASDWD